MRGDSTGSPRVRSTSGSTSLQLSSGLNLCRRGIYASVCAAHAECPHCSAAIPRTDGVGSAAWPAGGDPGNSRQSPGESNPDSGGSCVAPEHECWRRWRRTPGDIYYAAFDPEGRDPTCTQGGSTHPTTKTCRTAGSGAGKTTGGCNIAAGGHRHLTGRRAKTRLGRYDDRHRGWNRAAEFGRAGAGEWSQGWRSWRRPGRRGWTSPAARTPRYGFPVR
jgi:hypothetical protein